MKSVSRSSRIFMSFSTVLDGSTRHVYTNQGPKKIGNSNTSKQSNLIKSTIKKNAFILGVISDLQIRVLYSVGFPVPLFYQKFTRHMFWARLMLIYSFALAGWIDRNPRVTDRLEILRFYVDSHSLASSLNTPDFSKENPNNFSNEKYIFGY